MEKQTYKLTLNIGPYQKEILDRYCKRTNQNYTEAFKCWLMNLPEAKEKEDEERK